MFYVTYQECNASRWWNQSCQTRPRGDHKCELFLVRCWRSRVACSQIAREIDLHLTWCQLQLPAYPLYPYLKVNAWHSQEDAQEVKSIREFRLSDAATSLSLFIDGVPHYFLFFLGMDKGPLLGPIVRQFGGAQWVLRTYTTCSFHKDRVCKEWEKMTFFKGPWSNKIEWECCLLYTSPSPRD